jgi:ATP-dependent Lon protease
MDPIPPALRDRMEIIQLPGYTEPQKVEIARRYLVPRQLEENGLGEKLVEFNEAAIAGIISDYTREAGVRNVEREIARILRKVARRIAENGRKNRKIKITPRSLSQYLGPRRFYSEVTRGKDQVGIATGLAVTEAGGEILFVEVTLIPGGKGNLILTGRLGDVMQESARAALTYAATRSQKFGVAPDFREKYDLHIHVPAGATPKDGPSAGVAMAAALVSAISGRPLHKRVGMTGEITLQGRVLPIGGVKAKILAAHRAGCSEVILPKDNDKDMEDIPDFVRKEMKITFVGHMDELLPIVLAENPHKISREVKPRPAAVSGRRGSGKGRSAGRRAAKR